MSRRAQLGVFLALCPLSVCAEDARRYVATFDCGAARIEARGAECVSEYDCPSISLVTHERISYRIGDKTYSLPSLQKQFPKSLHARETDRVYRISSVKCQNEGGIAILYWGGGNCSSVCEAAVTYEVSGNRLRPTGISKQSWRSLPFIKEYADREAVTRWIDARPN
jgi:hypothetical protein